MSDAHVNMNERDRLPRGLETVPEVVDGRVVWGGGTGLGPPVHKLSTLSIVV
jgi:hypothetical protein